jgi:hypothetical protein
MENAQLKDPNYQNSHKENLIFSIVNITNNYNLPKIKAPIPDGLVH